MAKRGPYKVKPAEPRFWAKVRTGDGCWEWTGATVRGYGVIEVEGRQTYAHRYSWVLANGPIPVGLLVLHHCDNPPCVRPSHLAIGTQADNLRDAAQKHRMSHGEDRFNHKATEDDVRRMRQLYAEGVTVRDMAPLFPISERTIRKIIARRNWRHI